MPAFQLLSLKITIPLSELARRIASGFVMGLCPAEAPGGSLVPGRRISLVVRTLRDTTLVMRDAVGPNRLASVTGSRARPLAPRSATAPLLTTKNTAHRLSSLHLGSVANRRSPRSSAGSVETWIVDQDPFNTSDVAAGGAAPFEPLRPKPG